jgi:hypothetical protein
MGLMSAGNSCNCSAAFDLRIVWGMMRVGFVWDDAFSVSTNTLESLNLLNCCTMQSSLRFYTTEADRNHFVVEAHEGVIRWVYMETAGKVGQRVVGQVSQDRRAMTALAPCQMQCAQISCLPIPSWAKPSRFPTISGVAVRMGCTLRNFYRFTSSTRLGMSPSMEKTNALCNNM